MNAKNQIQELLAKKGLPLSAAVYTSTQDFIGGPWTSTVVLTLPGQPPITGTGKAMRKTQADVAAAEDALAKLKTEPSPTDHDWAQIQADAQAGDALLKLATYLAHDLASPEARSLWLQEYESDAALARVFDIWFEAGDPDLAAYGAGLGEKNKATLVEALVWRRYGKRVLAHEAGRALRELREALIYA